MEVDDPSLNWVNTGEKKIGQWPCLVFRSYEAAIFSGLKIPPQGSDAIIKLKNKMKLPSTHVMIYMLEIHAWTCLSEKSKRIHNASMEDFTDFERVEQEYNRDRGHHELVSFEKALLHSERIYETGFEKWFAYEQLKEKNLLAVDILASEVHENVMNNNLESGNNCFDKLPQILSILDGESQIVTERIKWVSSFLQLRRFVHLPEKILDSLEDGQAPEKNTEKRRTISPTNVLDVSYIEDNLESTLYLERNPDTGIINCSEALDLSKDIDTKKTNYKLMVESLVRRSSDYCFFFHHSCEYFIEKQEKEMLDEAFYFVQLSKFREAFDAFEALLSNSNNDDEFCGDILHVMAAINFKAQNYDIRLCKEALLVRNNILRKGHPKIAESLRLLGLGRIYHGDFEKALQCFLHAYEIFKAEYGQHIVVSSLLKCIGCVHFLLDQFLESLSAFERALRIEQSLIFTENDLLINKHLKCIASTLSQIGCIQILIGNKTSLEESQATLREVEVIYDYLLPLDHEYRQTLKSMLALSENMSTCV